MNKPSKKRGKSHSLTPIKKQAFIEALPDALGIVETACTLATQTCGYKVAKSSVYEWLRVDEGFAQKVEEARNLGDKIGCNLAVSKLIQRIQGMSYTEEVVVKEGRKYKTMLVQKFLPPDVSAINIYLSAKGQHLGFGKQKLEHSGEVITKNIQVIIANPYDEDNH